MIEDTGATGATGVTGPTGPSGVTGAANGLNAYGGIYSDTPQTLGLTVGGTTVIPMANAMASNNVTPNANSITIAQSGNYEIIYKVDTTASAGGAVTLAVRDNGVNIPATVTTKTLAVGVANVYQGHAIVALTAGDVLDLAFTAPVALSLTLGTGTNASLTVKKLDA